MDFTSFSNKPIISPSYDISIQNFARLRFRDNGDGTISTVVGDIIFNLSKDENNRVVITTTDLRDRCLGDVPCGHIIRLGSDPWVVLGHGKDTTALMSTNPCAQWWRCIPYERTILQDALSHVKETLGDVVGASNIIRHTTDLRMANGKNKGYKMRGYVSILTLDLFQRYYDYLPQGVDIGTYALATQWDPETYIVANNARELRLMRPADAQVSYLPFAILDSRVAGFADEGIEARNTWAKQSKPIGGLL